MRSAIEAEGPTFAYPRRPVFESVDFQIQEGVTGLLGPNGAGKSTLLNLIATVLRPRRGSLRIAGLDPSRRDHRRAIRAKLGYLTQSFGYYPSFTALEFVEYAAWLKEVPPGQIRRRAMTALEQVGLVPRARSTMRSLSGGMLRRPGSAAPRGSAT